MLNSLKIISFFVFLLSFSSVIFSQTTIFNVPSTDVVSPKTVYAEGDFIAHFDKYENGGFQTYGYRTVYGITRKFEVGTNFFYTKSSSPSVKEFHANAKYKFYENEKYNFAVSGGTQVIVPLKDKTGQKTFTMVYSNASKVIRKTNGMRLTGGYYGIFGGNKDFGTKRGFLLGLEQPITKRVTLLADWYSGRNRLGYSFAGFSTYITKRQTIFAGYNFGNSGRGNNSFSFAYGYTY
jgi:hypothetical protein